MFHHLFHSAISKLKAGNCRSMRIQNLFGHVVITKLQTPQQNKVGFSHTRLSINFIYQSDCIIYNIFYKHDNHSISILFLSKKQAFSCAVHFFFNTNADFLGFLQNILLKFSDKRIEIWYIDFKSLYEGFNPEFDMMWTDSWNRLWRVKEVHQHFFACV